MNNSEFKNLDEAVRNCLARHKSILDVITKFQESSSKVTRAVAKSATVCGCIEINAKKQIIPPDVRYSQLKEFMTTHVQGEICSQCKEILEKEMGNSLFYLAALCHILNMPISDVVDKEIEKLSTLGIFNLS